MAFVTSALGVKSVPRAIGFGLACTLVGALAISFVWLSFDAQEQTSRTTIGVGVNSDAGLIGQTVPDIGEMMLNSVPLHLRDDYHVQPPDILQVKFTGSSPDLQDKEMKAAGGERLVTSDGVINLGDFGSLHVAGLTLSEIKSAIQRQMDFAGRNWQVEVSVLAQNSHVYYVVFEGGAGGDRFMRYPAVGDDTLLDALCQVGRFNDLRTKRIWIARPQPGSSVDQVLPVHWKWTSDQTATCTNYHILPGDRIFVKELPWWMKLIEKVAAFQG
jgi:hypothetical protein